ncbi:TetR family transcriptional regulator C-terminal domain-containing protein [Streptomyces sp. NPDC001315]|uniref:LmrA/YxaF family transcription factor n=1 Tax=Streptomyces sp. NPDC001315 TaxID=3364562 RepID=UPI00368164A0
MAVAGRTFVRDAEGALADQAVVGGRDPHRRGERAAGSGDRAVYPCSRGEFVDFGDLAPGASSPRELPGEGTDAALWRAIVVESDFRAGCPVLAVAIEEPPADDEIPPALAAAAEVFDQWENLLATSLREHGAEAEQSAQLATLVVAAVEGTVALCRAKRSTEPLDRTAGQLQALIAGAIKR